MPNPKKKISTTRRDKRRTHYKAVAPTLSIALLQVRLT
jgi:large subunit ribosomal protein L32